MTAEQALGGKKVIARHTETCNPGGLSHVSRLMFGPCQRYRSVIAALCGIAYFATLHHGALLVEALLQGGGHEMSVVNVDGQAEVVFSHAHDHDHTGEHDDEIDGDHADSAHGLHMEDHHHGDHVVKLSSGGESTLASSFKWRVPMMVMTAVPGSLWSAERPVFPSGAMASARVRPPPLYRGATACLRTTVLVI